MRPVKRCLGFGASRGRCESPAGHPRKAGEYPASKHWCLPCDRARMSYIGQQLSAIVAGTTCPTCGLVDCAGHRSIVRELGVRA